MQFIGIMPNVPFSTNRYNIAQSCLIEGYSKLLKIPFHQFVIGILGKRLGNVTFVGNRAVSKRNT